MPDPAATLAMYADRLWARGWAVPTKGRLALAKHGGEWFWCYPSGAIAHRMDDDETPLLVSHARCAAQRELRAWQLRPENHHTDRWVKVRQALLASSPDGEPDDAAIVAAVEGVKG